VCPGCLRTEVSSSLPIASDKEKLAGFYVVYAKYRYLAMEVPSCEECARKKQTAVKVGGALAVVGFIVALVVEIGYDVDLGMGRYGRILIGGSAVAPGVLLAMYKDQPVRISDFRDDAVVFRFKLKEYAEAFCRLNAKLDSPSESTQRPGFVNDTIPG